MQIHPLRSAGGCVLAWLLSLASAPAQTGKATLSVEKIHANPALERTINGQGKGPSLQRVVESFDSQLIDRLHNTRKFEVVAVKDLNDVMKAEGRTGQAAEDKAPKFGLVTTLDDFEDSTEKLELKTLNQIILKRKIRLSCVAKIWNVSTKALYESANIQILTNDSRTDLGEVQKNAELTDRLLVDAVRDAAQRVADRVVDAAFPAKIVAKTENQITINRGDGSSIEVGQMWNVCSAGKKLIDPDTGEVLGQEEVVVGKARIVNVLPKTSTAEILEGADKIGELMVLRRPPAGK